jgi:predicted transcriptional regulator
MRKKRLPMGALEDAVMDVLWTDSSWMTPGEVHAHLASQRDLAYTTVTTVMVRLFDKGRLERRKDGRAFAYHALSTRTEWAAARMDEVLGAMADRKSTLTLFLDRLDDDDRTQLRRMLIPKDRP